MIYPHLTPDDYPELLALDVGAKIPTIWDPRYVTRAAPLTSTTKAGLVIEARREDLAIVIPPLDLINEFDLVWQDIARWHSPGYVYAVRTGAPRRLAEAQGFTWSLAFADSVARIWHNQHVAQRLAHILGRAVLHPVSGAHHARPESGAGFCTFNYAVAALGLVRDDRPDARVAVIDLDAHFGDGTMAFADAQPELALHIFDVHGGRTARHAFARRRRVYTVENIDQYRKAVTNLPQFLREHEITDAVYLAGMDPYEHDPLGRVEGVDASFLQARDQYVLTQLALAGVATVVNFAGGYVPDKVVELHGGTITAMQSAARLADFGASPRARALLES